MDGQVYTYPMIIHPTDGSEIRILTINATKNLDILDTGKETDKEITGIPARLTTDFLHSRTSTYPRWRVVVLNDKDPTMHSLTSQKKVHELTD